MKKYLPWSISLFMLIFFLTVILRTKNDDNIMQIKECSVKTNYNLENALRRLPAEQLRDVFPYDAYLDSSSICDISVIKNDIAVLDKLYGDPDMSKRLISIALTEKLENKSAGKLASYDPDYLLSLMQWGEKFKAYAELDKENYYVFDGIYGFWMDKISNKLVDYSQEDNSLKYEFKFKYLAVRCNEKKHSVGLAVTKTEKFLQNITYNKWNHLLNASWAQSSNLQRIIFSLLIIFTLYAYFLFFKKILNRK